MSFENGLFIFRRDYRIIDNHGLLLANTKCKNVFTIFIFTPEQVGSSNQYKSNNCVQFMIESLEELSDEISKKGGKLYSFYGDNIKIINEVVKKFNIDYICFNMDYTPYSLKRDNEIIHFSKKHGIECEMIGDYYLHEPGTILNSTNNPYQKFTPYYNSCVKKIVDKPISYKKINFVKKQIFLSNTISLNDAFLKFTKENKNILLHGGRSNAIVCLKRALKTQTKYSQTHNDLDKNTTQLSAFIKFGCLSIREIYWAFKPHGFHDLIRQLIWRDFYMNILYFFPYVLGKPMKPAYSKIKWHHNSRWLESWKKGETGFPIVDAGMREMNKTGFMHNRSRLIVASFLVKTLLINWQHGEKYFATMLTDYDVASNNGNWQWIASTGADSQPYFRIFNPWLQSEEYDPDAKYIKKWIPELAEISPKEIHKWYNYWTEYKNIYTKPICDYEAQKEMALQMYKKIYS